MIDAFDAAAGQVKVETEGEKKIAESYQVRRPASRSSLAFDARHITDTMQRTDASDVARARMKLT